jgi:DNA-binding NarL/FixJ family response regulator
MSGTEACERLVATLPGTRVVVLTSFPNEGVMMNAFSAGARGFVLKESESIVLRQAVRTVADGGTYADPRVAAKLVALATKGKRAKGPFDLTLQEMRILEQLPRGLTNQEIGEELGISQHTVKTHLRHAMQKLKAKDRAEAAAIALREGLA